MCSLCATEESLAAVPVNDSYELCAVLRMHTRDSEGLLIAV